MMGRARNDENTTSHDATKMKTKGKRSKLNQRRPSSQKDAAKAGGGTQSRRIVTEEGGGPAGLAGAAQNTNPSNHIFGAGDMGDMGNESDVDGGLMQQGSPTLLSALKSSSLRASAYGQDFTTSFKEDDMSLLGEFKNAASRFSQLNPLGNSIDGLTTEGDMGSEALWSSFPVDVDSFMPSRTSAPYGEMGGSGRYSDVGGMGGGAGAGAGASAGNAPNVNQRVGGGDDAEMFRSGSNQYVFQYGEGNAGGGAVGAGGRPGAPQPSMSTGGMSFDSSFENYGNDMHQQGGNRGGMHIRGQMPAQSNSNAQLNFSGQQQGAQVRQMRYAMPGAQGQSVGFVPMSYQQQSHIQGQQMQQNGMMLQQAYQYSQMVHVPSTGSLQQPHQQQGQGVRKVPDAGVNDDTGKGKRPSSSKKVDEKRKASKGNERAGEQPVGMPAPGAMAPNQMVSMGLGNYGMQLMQPMQGQPLYSHQMNASDMMMQPQNRAAAQMYSGSSSVSTVISAGGMGSGGRVAGAQIQVPQYAVNQMTTEEEVGLVELQAIVGKLDKPTSRNIKESLYRLALSARNRGGRFIDGSGHAQAAQPSSDKSTGVVDRCVANLLYHKYTDSPGATVGAPEPGQQQQNSEGTTTVMQQQSSGLGGRGVKPSDMSGLNVRGRHGSA